MASASRAQRRRQERAAAKRPAEVEGLRLVYQRSGGDCLRAAVATVLQIDYDETPEADGYDPAAREIWRAWTEVRGLKMTQNLSHAPAWLADPWIAIVTGQGGDPHAVVMRRGRMLHNGTPTTHRRPLSRRDVLASILVGTPEWVEATRARTLELIRAGSREVWELDTPLAREWRRNRERQDGRINHAA